MHNKKYSIQFGGRCIPSRGAVASDRNLSKSTTGLSTSPITDTIL